MAETPHAWFEGCSACPKAFIENLVLIGPQVDAAALWAGFAVHVPVDFFRSEMIAEESPERVLGSMPWL
jgi:hypothetical protein